MHESVQSVFKVGMKLEVVDKMRISQVRVASVVDITGRRLQLSYDEGGDASGFWCHEESPLIHPVGESHCSKNIFGSDRSSMSHFVRLSVR